MGCQTDGMLWRLMIEDVTEHKWISRARAGDHHAFEMLVQRYSPRLLRQAALLCSDTQSAADVAQETLIQAWKSIGRFRGGSGFFTWLCAILFHCHRNWVRSELRSSRWKGVYNSCRAMAGIADERLATVAASPDGALSEAERGVILRTCLNRLPEKHRAVVYLRFYVDESLDSIAAALECPVGTVKSRLSHGLEKLAAMKELEALASE
jgi:RNA polymerase sigma-70 factor, ECF subfamily